MACRHGALITFKAGAILGYLPSGRSAGGYALVIIYSTVLAGSRLYVGLSLLPTVGWNWRVPIFFGNANDVGVYTGCQGQWLACPGLQGSY